MAVSWLMRLVFGQTPRRPRFDPRLMRVRSVVGKVGLGPDFLRALRFPPVSVIPSMLHIHLHLNAAPTGNIPGTHSC
jgi:anti-sigma factor RsiW